MTSTNFTRGRAVAFLVVALLAAGAATWYLVRAAREPEKTGPGLAVATGPVTGPRIVFRNAGIGEDAGRVAVVPLADPAGPRTLTDVTCDRVHATATGGMCLAQEAGVVTRQRVKILDADLKPVREGPLLGIPSRTQVSGDGRFGVSTVFVSGHSYAAGTFSTATVIERLDTGESLGNLEDFTYVRDGKEVDPPDLNVWGVTFAPDGATFYATASSGGRRDLVVGDTAKREFRNLRGDVECPSLSPDGQRIAYKKPVGDGSRPQWRLHVLDLRTGEDVALPEQRTVDDQVEWLDDEHVLYGMPQEPFTTAETDVWVTPVRGGTPRVFLPAAWSPAVVR